MTNNPLDPELPRYLDLQDAVLQHYGVHARPVFVDLRRPRLRIHVLEAGAGEPLLIFHGGDGEAWNWAPLLAELQNEFRVFAVDRPGFGLSDPFDYSTVDIRGHAGEFAGSLLDALNLETAVILGGSMGGYFALCAALDHPGRVRRLVLVGMPVGFIQEVPDSLQAVVNTPGLAEQFMDRVSTLEGQHWQYREMFHIDLSRIPPLYFEARAAGVNRPGAKRTWATLLRRMAGGESMSAWTWLGADYHRIAAPTLTIWGADDMAPASIGRQAMAAFPNGRFEVLPDVGHFPFLEAPAQTAHLIRQFLAAGS